MIEFQGGRLPPQPDKPRLSLSKYLTDEAAPTHVDWLYKVSNWPMYLNDRIGDCTCAAAGHIIEALSAFGQGQTQVVSEPSVLGLYESVSGYDPNTGKNDNGAVMQEVLGAWRKDGLEGHHILAFAQVDPTRQSELVKAMAAFGSLYLGINFPASAMDQFNRGAPWDVVQGSRLEGGHAINAGYYDLLRNEWRVVTWGRVQPMTQAFFNEYVEEAWVVMSPEWLSVAGLSPEGLDLYALSDDFEELTGEPGPFPRPGPPAPPTPEPPAPTTVCGKIKKWLSS